MLVPDPFVEEDEGWDVLQDIPNDTAAALVLIEHHWAVPLQDAIVRAGGFRISDGFISPLDLVEIGLASSEEAHALHAHRDGHRDGLSTTRRGLNVFGSRRVARRKTRRFARRRRVALTRRA